MSKITTKFAFGSREADAVYKVAKLYYTQYQLLLLRQQDELNNMAVNPKCNEMMLISISATLTETQIVSGQFIAARNMFFILADTLDLKPVLIAEPYMQPTNYDLLFMKSLISKDKKQVWFSIFKENKKAKKLKIKQL